MASSSSSAAYQLVKNLIKVAAARSCSRRIPKATTIQDRIGNHKLFGVYSLSRDPNSWICEADIILSQDNHWIDIFKLEEPILKGIVHQGKTIVGDVLNAVEEEGEVVERRLAHILVHTSTTAEHSEIIFADYVCFRYVDWIRLQPDHWGGNTGIADWNGISDHDEGTGWGKGVALGKTDWLSRYVHPVCQGVFSRQNIKAEAMQIEAKSIMFRVGRVDNEWGIGKRLKDAFPCYQIAVIRRIRYIVVVRAVDIDGLALEEKCN